ncbi:MAG: nucleotide exchange factor GrpE [Proteobacteria bacterium]|nr:nucleotide exchange factor GrpE [Pseudomonadota bacterium]
MAGVSAEVRDDGSTLAHSPWGEMVSDDRLPALLRDVSGLLTTIGALRSEMREQGEKAEKQRRHDLLDLIAVVDGFEDVVESLESVKAKMAADEQRPFQRLRIVGKQLTRWLNQRGVQAFDAVGEFDPHLHLAVDVELDASRPAGAIARQLKRGYRVNGLLLRAAHVVVITDDPTVVNVGTFEERG